MRGWLLGLAASACGAGHGGNTASDAASVVPIDATPIAPVDPMCAVLGVPGVVTLEPPAAAGNLSIVVSDNTGVTLSRIDGVATGAPVTLTVPACGMVTAVRTGIPDAITWTGVQPGDDLTDPRIATAPITVKVSAQAASGEPSYNLYVSCADGLTLQDGEGTAADFAWISLQCPANDTAIAASFVAGYVETNAYATVTSAAITSGTASLTFGVPAAAPVTTHVDLSGVAAYDEVDIQTHQVPAAGLDVPYALARLDATGSDSIGGDADAGSGGGTLVVSAESGYSGEVKTTTRVDAYDALPTTAAIDASTLLPLVTYSESISGARFALGLSTPAPTNASVTVANLAIGASSSWMIVAPADAPVLYPPYLPTDLVTALDAETLVRNVIVYDIPELPTYADARAHLDRLPQGSPTTAMRITRVDTNDTLGP